MVDIIDGITVNISSYTYDRKSCKALLGNDEFKKVSIYLFVFESCGGYFNYNY